MTGDQSTAGHATDDLTRRLADKATLSWTPRLYAASGGIDPDLPIGSDVEFCYRLTQTGAVLIPEAEARSWHLSPAQPDIRATEVTRTSEPFLRHRLPLVRHWRTEPGRQWKVPYVDVVVEVHDCTYEDVAATVRGALASSLPDVGVSIVGPWAKLTDEPHQPVAGSLLELRLIHEAFVHDGRVTLWESVPATSAPVPFRFVCPAGLVPTPSALERLVGLADQNQYGIVLLAVNRGPDLLIARLDRTEAVARALAMGQPDDLVDIVQEVSSTHWIDGSEWALVLANKAPTPVSTSALLEEVDKWKKEALRRRTEAERWKKEATRLKQAGQVPLRAQLVRAAKRRIPGVRLAKRLAGKRG